MFPKIGVPQNGWFIRETPIEMDDLGGKPTIFGNIHLDFPSFTKKGSPKSLLKNLAILEWGLLRRSAATFMNVLGGDFIYLRKNTISATSSFVIPVRKKKGRRLWPRKWPENWIKITNETGVYLSLIYKFKRSKWVVQSVILRWGRNEGFLANVKPGLVQQSITWRIIQVDVSG